MSMSNQTLINELLLHVSRELLRLNASDVELFTRTESERAQLKILSDILKMFNSPRERVNDLTPDQIGDIFHAARNQFDIDHASVCKSAFDQVESVGLDHYFIRQIVFFGLEKLK